MIITYNLTVMVIGLEAFVRDRPWSVLAYLPDVESRLINKFYQLIIIFIAINNALCFDIIFFIFVNHIYMKLTIIYKIFEMLECDKSIQYLKSTYKINGILIEIHTIYIEIIE